MGSLIEELREHRRRPGAPGRLDRQGETPRCAHDSVERTMIARTTGLLADRHAVTRPAHLAEPQAQPELRRHPAS